VDNGSADGIEEHIAKDFPSIRFFQIGYNSGFSKATNLGIKESRGEYIMLLNNDTIITELVFDQLTDFMSAHPDTGAIGPRHADGRGRFQVSYGKFPTIFSEIERKIIQFRILCGDPTIDRYFNEFCYQERKVDWLSGSCLLLRRDALCQTGLLDESLFMYYEDVDICKRIIQKGWSIYYFPKTSIVHYLGGSAKENESVSLFEHSRSQLCFAKKYYGKIGETIIRAFLFLRFSIAGCRNIVKFCVMKMFGKEAQAVYAHIALSFKIVTMALLSKAAESVEPVLNA